MSAKMTQEAKKDDFLKYLEKAVVLELLTKSLVQVTAPNLCSCLYPPPSSCTRSRRSPRTRRPT